MSTTLQFHIASLSWNVLHLHSTTYIYLKNNVSGVWEQQSLVYLIKEVINLPDSTYKDDLVYNLMSTEVGQHILRYSLDDNSVIVKERKFRQFASKVTAVIEELSISKVLDMPPEQEIIEDTNGNFFISYDLVLELYCQQPGLSSRFWVEVPYIGGIEIIEVIESVPQYRHKSSYRFSDAEIIAKYL